jgi:hypothetical protein
MDSPQTIICVGITDWRAVLAEPERCGALLAHLESCATCQLRLEAQLSGDPLAQSLRAAQVSELTSGEGVELRLPAGFDLLGEVGRGGQAVVFKALQVSTERPVALKMLLNGIWATAEQKQRLHREARLLARLKHPHVVEVYSSGETAEGVPYLALEWIEGQALETFVEAQHATGGPQALTTLLRVFDQLAAAIEAAHAAKVLHRDLKPSNVLIDGRGEPHVLDFGLAKSLGSDPSRTWQVTQPGEFLGSLAWASPEQLEPTGQVDERTDVHGLGLLLYFMLTGDSAHGPTESIKSLVLRITNVTPLPPSRKSRVGPLPSGLDAVVLRALSKEPNQRFASVEELRFALSAIGGKATQRTRWRQALLGGLLGVTLLGLARFALHEDQWRSIAVEAAEQPLALQASAPAVMPTPTGAMAAGDIQPPVPAVRPSPEMFPAPGRALLDTPNPALWAARDRIAQEGWAAAWQLEDFPVDCPHARLAVSSVADVFVVARALQASGSERLGTLAVSEWELLVGRLSSGRLVRRMRHAGINMFGIEIDPWGRWFALTHWDGIALWPLEAKGDENPFWLKTSAPGCFFSGVDRLAISPPGALVAEYDLNTRALIREIPWGTEAIQLNNGEARFCGTPDGAYALHLGHSREVRRGIVAVNMETGQQSALPSTVTLRTPLFLSKRQFRSGYLFFSIDSNGAVNIDTKFGYHSNVDSNYYKYASEGKMFRHSDKHSRFELIDGYTLTILATVDLDPVSVLATASCPRAEQYWSLDQRGLLRCWQPNRLGWLRREPVDLGIYSSEECSIDGLTGQPGGQRYFTANARSGTLGIGRSGSWTQQDLCSQAVGSMVNGVAVSPSGEYLACSGFRGVHLGPAGEPECLRLVYATPAQILTNAVAFSPDSRLLAACLGDGRVIVLETSSGAVVQNHWVSKSRVGSLAFDSTGSRIYCGTGDGQVLVLSLDSGKVDPVELVPNGNIGGLASDGAGLVASGSFYGTLTLWREGLPIPVYSEELGVGFLYALEFCGPYLFCCDQVGTFWILDKNSGAVLMELHDIQPVCMDILVEPELDRIGFVGRGEQITWLELSALDRSVAQSLALLESD